MAPLTLDAVRKAIKEEIQSALRDFRSEITKKLDDIETRLSRLEGMEERIKDGEARVIQAECDLNVAKAKIEKLEQYSRRDCVKIYKYAEKAGETTDEAVVKIAAKMGVKLEEKDISVSHRVPKRGTGTNPIVCKFVRRNNRNEMMTNKKKLKELDITERDEEDNKRFKEVFVTDHLTPERARLLRKLQNHPRVEKAYSIDGKLRVHLRDDRGRITIESLDEIHKLGWSERELIDLAVFAPMTYEQDAV